jgi:hypothetical protein
MLLRSKVNAFATQKQCFRNSKAMLSNLGRYAFQQGDSCFLSPKTML